MKSFIKGGIGKVITDYGTKVMDIAKKGNLGRSLFSFIGSLRADSIQFPELPAPGTPAANKGGVIYVKDDGKPYFKSSTTSETDLTQGGGGGGVTSLEGLNGALDLTAGNNISISDNGSDTITIGVTGVVTETTTHIHEQVKNVEGSTIPAGTPVYAIDEVGNSGKVRIGKADASNAAKMPAIGILDTQLINNAEGTATLIGIFNTNLTGYTGLDEGDVVYVASGGGLTATKPAGSGNLIQNMGIILKTNGTTIQGLQVTCIGRTNDVPNLDNGYIFYGDSNNQASSTQLSTLLPPDLTVGGAGTIHVNNVPTLNQNTTGNAATVTNGVYTSGNQTIADTKTFSSTLTYSGANNHSLSLNNTSATGSPFISFNQNGSRKSFIQHNDTGDTIKIASEYGRISLQTGTGGAETAFLDIENDGVIRFGAVDADSVLTTDGNMTFRIDADNNETSQKFIFQNNASTEIASLNESGVLDLEDVIRPNITSIKILPRDFIADDVGRPVQIDDSTSNRFLISHSTAKMYASVDIPPGFKATAVDIYGDGTSSMTVYEADINSSSPTSLGNGSIGTTFTISSGLESNNTNYLLIELSQTSSERVYGGKVTIAKI